MPATDKPTARQLRYLKALAIKRGVSFTPPATRSEASRTIGQLRKRAPDSHADRRREAAEVSQALATGDNDSRIRSSEIQGYGASATWKERS